MKMMTRIRRRFLPGSVAFILSLAVSIPLYSNESSVHVLCYHAFKGDANIFSFSLEELKSHIGYLKNHGYTFLTIDDMTEKRFSGTRNILVTIDDGNKTVYDAYYKVLKPNGIKPLLSIYPAIIGKKDYALTWKQLRGLSDDGCSVAAHGYYHQMINQKLYVNNRKLFDGEIFNSKKVLEEKLEKSIDAFVYPFGVKSDITVKTLRAAGFKYGFTIQSGGLSPDMIDGMMRYELPRYMFTRTSQKTNLALITKNMMYRKKKNIAHEETADEKKTVTKPLPYAKKVEEKKIASGRAAGADTPKQSNRRREKYFPEYGALSGTPPLSDNDTARRAAFSPGGNVRVIEAAFASDKKTLRKEEKKLAADTNDTVIEENPDAKDDRKENPAHDEKGIKGEMKKNFYGLTSHAYSSYLKTANLFSKKIYMARNRAENLVGEKEKRNVK